MSSSDTNSNGQTCHLSEAVILEIGTILLTGMKPDKKPAIKKDYKKCYETLSNKPITQSDPVTGEKNTQPKLDTVDDFKNETSKLLDTLNCNFYKLLTPPNIITSLSLTLEISGNANKAQEAMRKRYIAYLGSINQFNRDQFTQFQKSADTLIEKVYGILKDSTNSAIIDVLRNIILNEPFFDILLGLMNIEKKEFTNLNSKIFYFALFFMLFNIFPLESSRIVKFAEITKNIDTNINSAEMNEVFDVMNNEKRAKLDARQYLTVNRFSKYRYRSIDKACFLFHGVGTGKTITSVSIALSHLTDKHLFNMEGPLVPDNEPLKIVIVAPQGLFRASFIYDFKKLAIYTNNIIINTLENGGQIESCNGYVKYDDKGRFYKLEIIGYDYNSFFKDTSIVNMANATSVNDQITTATNDEPENNLPPKSTSDNDDYKKMDYNALTTYMRDNKIKIIPTRSGKKPKTYLIKLIDEHRRQNNLPIASPLDSSNKSVATLNKYKKSALDYLEDEKYDVLIMDEAHRLLTNKLKPEENYFGFSIDCANINDEVDNLSSDNKYVNIKTIEEAVTIYDRESDSEFRIGEIVRRNKQIYTIQYDDGTTVEKLKSELLKLNDNLFIEHTDEEDRLVLGQTVGLDIEDNSMLGKTVLVDNPSPIGVVPDPYIRTGKIDSRNDDTYKIKYDDNLNGTLKTETVKKEDLLNLNKDLKMDNNAEIIIPQVVLVKTKDKNYIKIYETIKNDTRAKLFKNNNSNYINGKINSFDTNTNKYNILLDNNTTVQKSKQELIDLNKNLTNSIKKVSGKINSFDTTNNKYNILLDNNTTVQKSKQELLNLKTDLIIEDSQEKEDRFVVRSKVMVDYSTTYTKGHRKNTFTDGRFLRFCEKFSQVILLTGTPFQSSESDIVDITYFLTNPKINKSSFSHLCYDSKTAGGINNIFTTFKTNDTQGQAFMPTLCKNAFHFLMSLPGADTGQYGGGKEAVEEQNREISLKAAGIGATIDTILMSFDKVIDNSISAVEMAKKTVELLKNIQSTIESANTLVKDFESSKDETKDLGDNIYGYINELITGNKSIKQIKKSDKEVVANTANNVVLANNNNIRLVCKIENINNVDDNADNDDNKQKGGLGYIPLTVIASSIGAILTYQYGKPAAKNLLIGIGAYESWALSTTGRSWLVGLSQYFANANTYLPQNLRLAIAQFGNNLDNIEQVFGTMFNANDWKNSFKWASIGIRVFSKIMTQILVMMYAYVQYAKNNYQAWIESFSGLIKEKVGELQKLSLSQVINYLTNEIKSVITAAIDKLTVLDVEQQAAIKAAMNAAWFSMVRMVFFDILKFKKFDLDAIVKYTSPYISIYNYDHAQSAIDNTKFFTTLKSKNYSLNTPIIADGNTFAFPHKYVEQILVPFTREQEDKLINKKTKIQNTDIKTAFRVGCGIYNSDDEIIIGTSLPFYDDAKKNKLIESYKTNILGIYVQLATLSKANDRFKEVQLKEPYIQLDTLKREWNSDKSETGKQIAINITNSFNMLDIKPSTPRELKLWPGAHQQLTELQQIINKNLITYHDENKNFQYADTNKNLRFDNMLLLLKIIRCGAIYQNRKYYLHPHYVKKTDSTYEYYLPLIYPTTEDIMYGFCEYLNNKKINYIWMCNKFDKVTLDNNCNYGKFLTFPISNTDNNNPLCIIISPDHTEGFSFTFNPALFAPALCNSSGDEEQVYGRILRKYGQASSLGNYNKKIYQYFGASLADSQNLKYYAASYGVNNMNIWRDITYNNIPQNKIDISIKNNVFTNMVGQKLTSDTSHIINKLGQEFYIKINMLLKNHIVQETIEESKIKNSTDVTIVQNVLFDKNGVINKITEIDQYNPSSLNPIISEEFQLSTIYNVKQLCKEYFSKLVNIENNNNQFIPFDIQYCDKELSNTLCSPESKVNNILCMYKDLPNTDSEPYKTVINQKITPIKQLEPMYLKQLTEIDNTNIENTLMPIIDDYNDYIKILLSYEKDKNYHMIIETAYFTEWNSIKNIDFIKNDLNKKPREMNIIARLSTPYTVTPIWLKKEIYNTYKSIYDTLLTGDFYFVQVLRFYIKHKEFFRNLLYIYPEISFIAEQKLRTYYLRTFYIIDTYWKTGKINEKRNTMYEDLKRFVYPLILDGKVFVIDKTNPFIDTNSSWYRTIKEGTINMNEVLGSTLAKYAIPLILSGNVAAINAYKLYLLDKNVGVFNSAINYCLQTDTGKEKMLIEFTNTESELKKLFPHYILQCINMGNYKNDNKTTITYENSTYTGEVIFKDGKQIRDGYGRQQWKDDDLSYYEGEFKNDAYNGKGTFKFYKFGDPYDGYELKWIYEGEWKNGEKNGKGIQTYYNHKQLSEYDGEWKDDKFDGPGKLFYIDGSLYEGNFKEGKADDKTRQAKFRYKDGDYFLSKWDAGKPYLLSDELPDYYDKTGKQATFNKTGWLGLQFPEAIGGKRKFTMKRKKHRTRKYKSKHNRKTKQAKYKSTKKYNSIM